MSLSHSFGANNPVRYYSRPRQHCCSKLRQHHLLRAENCHKLSSNISGRRKPLPCLKSEPGDVVIFSKILAEGFA